MLIDQVFQRQPAALALNVLQQLAALSPIHTIAPHLSQHACEQLMGVEHERQQVWQAWLRRLDRLDTSYKD
ncbi:ribulose-5-phosphate 4-epimerase related epimerase / aldolase [Klebsiella pneumoniae]|nr:ribulose-5-phosphate 4-epimerase related epimerase / aldolase [Klebsiella pneumoniae]